MSFVVLFDRYCTLFLNLKTSIQRHTLVIHRQQRERERDIYKQKHTCTGTNTNTNIHQKQQQQLVDYCECIEVKQCQLWMCICVWPYDCASVWTWFACFYFITAMVLVLWIVFIITSGRSRNSENDGNERIQSVIMSRSLDLLYHSFGLSICLNHHAGWHISLCQITHTHTNTYAHTIQSRL